VTHPELLGWIDPADVFRHFAQDPYTMFLASGGPPGDRARYSYLCIDPVYVLRWQDGVLTQNGEPIAGHASTALNAWLAPARRLPIMPGLPPFQGGFVGFLGYECAGLFDVMPRAPGQFAGIPDLLFGMFDVVFAWDHATRRLYLCGPGHRAAAARARLADPAPALTPPPRLAWQANVNRATHMARVAETIALIRAGDIYQANITAPFAAPRPPGLDPAALFLRLLDRNPAPFAAYIGCGEGCAVASVSPERFLSVNAGGLIETRPIKGTRPRGATPEADAAEAAQLLASAKDRAENLMIVDLLRNDLARVAEPGSVAVPSLCALESFASVHHLVSAITARLRPGLGPLDMLRVAFPGGSITGAPKIRATEVIATLEAAARGPYCGSAAWIGFDGAMDSNILIRTVTVARDRVIAQAGGGIVADSDPAAEWDELMTKLSPILRALGTPP